MSYGKVKETFWTSKTVRSFSDDAKLLALYFLTGPHRNILGCMRVPNGYLVEDLKWTSERLADAIRMLCDKGWICRDDDGWTLICNQLEHDPLKVPNHARSAVSLAELVPTDSPIYQVLSEKLTANLNAIGMASLWHLHGKPIPEPSPEPEPLPEPNPPPVGESAPCSAAPPPAEKPPPKAKGSRLTSDWTLPEDWAEWATTELLPLGGGLPAILAYVDTAALRFRDHWLGKAGKDGVKLDWQATWRNWIRGDIERGKTPKGASNGKADAAGPGSSPDYVTRVMERQRARFGPGGPGGAGADAGPVLPAASGGQ